MNRFGLVVIDGVRAFTDPAGVIGRIHPRDQFSLILETVERLAVFAAEQTGPKVWVSSLYSQGQFSGGDLDHPLAQLCTDASSDDCAWDPRLVPPADALVVTKHSMDRFQPGLRRGDGGDGRRSRRPVGHGVYDPGDDHPAVVDVTIQLDQLRSHGVIVCDAPDDWQRGVTDR